MVFQDGFEAGRLLASRLRQFAHKNDVRALSRGGRFRWIVSGPLGTSATWESRITELNPNRLLAWRSAPGTLIRNAGIIRFQSTNDGGTRVRVQMSYKLPGGAMGHELATEPNWGTLSCDQPSS